MALVYSTDKGRLCSGCAQPVTACHCRQPAAAPNGDGVVRVQRQKNGRGGKTVTVVTGIPLAGEALKTLAKTLKQRCGSGGAVKDGVVEIQGDHRELLQAELTARGWTVKLSGG